MKTRLTSHVGRQRTSLESITRIAAFIVLLALISIPLFSSSSASSSNDSRVKGLEGPGQALSIIHEKKQHSVVSDNMFPASGARSMFPLLMPQGPPPPETVEIFQSDCTTSATSFNLGDTVCAKVSNTPANAFRRLGWVNTAGLIVQDADVTTDPQNFSFTLPATAVGPDGTDRRGRWSANSISSADSSVHAGQTFEVKDPANAAANLTVYESVVNGDPTVQAGQAISYNVVLTNDGPDDASHVAFSKPLPELIDSTATAPTFLSRTQISGPTFNCINDTHCRLASFPAGSTAAFVFVYTVDSSTPNDTVVKDSSSIGSDTTDPQPNSNQSSAYSTVVGTAGASPCVLTCPADVTVTADANSGGQPGSFVSTAAAAIQSGDCGSINNSPQSGSFLNVGVHTVVSTSDAGPSCTFTVTVLDSAPPTISCPANQTVPADAGQDYASGVNPGTPTTTPIAGSPGVTITGVRSDGTPAVYDEFGNVVTPAVVVPLTDPYPVGSTGILWTITDGTGRSASCNQTITVVANGGRAPVTISCPAAVTRAAPSGTCEATVSLADIGTATSNPSDSHVDVTAARSDGRPLTDPFPAGATAITWTAVDDINGSAASCTQIITVTVAGSGDTTPPTLVVPPNVSVTTSSCTATLDDELGAAQATDGGACGGSVTITRTGVPPNFVFPTGTTTVTYTATDAAGNSTSGTQQVTVSEFTPPSVTAPAGVSVNTGAGATICGAFVSDATLGTASASDNCPGVTLVRTGVPAGNIFPVGSTTVTYTATDRSGNTANATQTVIVTDNTPPIVTAPAAVTLFTGAGATSCGVVVSNLDATLGTGSATDNCPGVSAVSRSGVPAGNNFPKGTTTLTYSATDAHGNSASATQVVTVVDNTPPVISCPASITIEPTCPTGGKAFYTAPVGTDNCPGATTARTAGLASGSVFPIGTTTVTHTVTDAVGLTASCSFTVTVLTPQAVIQNLITSVSASSLTGTQKNGLLAKLNAALQGLNSGQTNVACNKMADFINSTQTFISHGDITAALGNAWISSANHVRNTIGCTNLGCT